MKNYETYPGESINHCARIICQMANEAKNEEDAVIQTKFNGILLAAIPGALPEDLITYYQEEVSKEDKKYKESNEYKILQEKLKSNHEAYDDAMANAPEMTFSDKEGWDQAVETNNDPYGQRTIKYASDWARMMEKTIAEGGTISSCAETTSYIADFDGITGFMHSCAVGMLKKYWAYGKELEQYMKSQ